MIQISIEGLSIKELQVKLQRGRAAVQQAVVGTNLFSIRPDDVRVVYPIPDLLGALQDGAGKSRRLSVNAYFRCARAHANAGDEWQEVAKRIGTAVQHVFCDSSGSVVCNVSGIETGSARIWKSHP